MGATPALQINAAKRILRLKGVLSGVLFTGTDKVRSGYGNGDCLYFDFKHKVFAVADGTERFPRASRDILYRLSDALVKAGVPDSATDWKALINRSVYAGQKYQHKTTFSCVAVSGDDDEVTLTVAHGGDSVVVVMDSISGEVLFQTGRNMVFAGRSREITDVIEYRVTDRNVRVVMHSDGLDDLLRFCIGQSHYSNISDAFTTFPIHDIGELIHDILMGTSGQFEHDDISLIAIEPFKLLGAEANRILMGGTCPHEETYFRKGSESVGVDHWIPQEEWALTPEIFFQSGIMIPEEYIP